MARLRSLRRSHDDVIVPAAVLAEGVFTGHPGHDARRRHQLGLTTIVPIDGPLGLDAGGLRQGVREGRKGRRPSGVDALVAAVADQVAATAPVRIVTSDVPDITALARQARHRSRITIARV